MDALMVWWIWVIVSAIFLLIELFTLTFFGLWMAIAAFVPAVLALIIQDIPAAWQIFIWIVSMIICAFIWVHIGKRNPPDQSIKEGIRNANALLADSMSGEFGEKGMMFQLSTRYIDALSSLGESDNAKIIAMPADLTKAVGGLVGAGVALGTGSESAQ